MLASKLNNEEPDMCKVSLFQWDKIFITFGKTLCMLACEAEAEELFV